MKKLQQRITHIKGDLSLQTDVGQARKGLVNSES